MNNIDPFLLHFLLKRRKRISFLSTVYEDFDFRIFIQHYNNLTNLELKQPETSHHRMHQVNRI